MEECEGMWRSACAASVLLSAQSRESASRNLEETPDPFSCCQTTTASFTAEGRTDGSFTNDLVLWGRTTIKGLNIWKPSSHCRGTEIGQHWTHFSKDSNQIHLETKHPLYGRPLGLHFKKRSFNFDVQIFLKIIIVMFFRQFWLETRKGTSSVLILNMHSCTLLNNYSGGNVSSDSQHRTNRSGYLDGINGHTHTHIFLWNLCSVSETADDSISDEGEQTGENI